MRSSSPGLRSCSGSTEAATRDQAGPLRRLAAVLRAPRRARYPTVLAFEDMQWADTSLLDFVESLLEWSRNYPIFVITLARPELQERRPGWGAGQRNFTSLLPRAALARRRWSSCSKGSCRACPESLRDQILARARGRAAVRGRDGADAARPWACSPRRARCTSRPARSTTLEVPETLHALIAARLDGCLARGAAAAPGRGGAREDVHGSGARGAAQARLRSHLDPLLASLVRKEVLGVQSDPRSPERGQYGFLQDLVRHVAYETLSKRERKNRHLAAADHLQTRVRRRGRGGRGARLALRGRLRRRRRRSRRAVDPRQRRARCLRAPGIGPVHSERPRRRRRYYEQAADLADEPLLEAALLEQAGVQATKANRPAEARARLERALDALYIGRKYPGRRPRQRCSCGRGFRGRSARRGGRQARACDRRARPDVRAPSWRRRSPSSAECASLSGRGEDAVAPLERALTLAERLQLPDVFVEALTSKALLTLIQGRLAEARDPPRGRSGAGTLGADVRERATCGEQPRRRARSLRPSCRGARDSSLARSRSPAAAATAAGNRNLRTGGLIQLFMLGRWDEALTIAAEEEPLLASESARASMLCIALIHCERGDLNAHARFPHYGRSAQ